MIQPRTAGGEGAEELSVEVVVGGGDDQRRLADLCSGQHRQRQPMRLLGDLEQRS